MLVTIIFTAVFVGSTFLVAHFCNSNLMAIFWACIALLSVSLLLAYLRSLRKNKSKMFLTPYRIVMLGLFLSAFLWSVPHYYNTYGEMNFQAYFMSLHNTIRMYLGEGLIEKMVEDKDFLLPEQKNYVAMGVFLSVLAPVMTFAFVLSFLKNALSYVRYYVIVCRENHVFSELNEKSLALATNITKRPRTFFQKLWGYRIVFTDVWDKQSEDYHDLVEKARNIGALLFKSDLQSISYRKKHSFRKMHFYLISDNEQEKLMHTEYIMENYDYDSVTLYVFSSDIRTEMMLSTHQKRMRIIRINDIRTLIYHNLDCNGLRIFQNASRYYNKKINAVIIGLGQYGMETLKALLWFCLFPGYELNITVFDADKNTEGRLLSLCPELKRTDTKGLIVTPEGTQIRVFSNADTASVSFMNDLAEIKDVSYVFVGLGSDKKNIETAVRLREFFGQHYPTVQQSDFRLPDIETVVYNSDICEKMKLDWEEQESLDGTASSTDKKKKNKEKTKDRRYSGWEYQIHMIGDLESFYSVETLPIDKVVKKNGEKSVSFGPLVDDGKSLDDMWNSSRDLYAIADLCIKTMRSKGNGKDSGSETAAFIKELRENSREFYDALRKGLKKAAKNEKKKGADGKQKEKSVMEVLKETDVKRVAAKVANFLGTYTNYPKPFFSFIPGATVRRLRAIKAHIGVESEFWRFEYNFNSSIAQALHTRFRRKLLEAQYRAVEEYVYLRYQPYAGRNEAIRICDMLHERNRGEIGDDPQTATAVSEYSVDELLSVVEGFPAFKNAKKKGKKKETKHIQAQARKAIKKCLRLVRVDPAAILQNEEVSWKQYRKKEKEFFRILREILSPEEYAEASKLVMTEDADVLEVLFETRTHARAAKLKNKLKKLAKAIDDCGLANKAIKDFTPEDYENVKNKFGSYKNLYKFIVLARTCSILDHVRWNAYMRSEGWVKGTKDKLSKTHRDLVPVEDLTYETWLKDI